MRSNRGGRPAGQGRRSRIRTCAGSARGVARGELGARAGLPVAVEQSEGHVVPERPLVVVDPGPEEEAADVDAVVDRLFHETERLPQDVGPPRVVVGPDAVLTDQEWAARELVVQAPEHDPEPLAPRG